MKLTPIVKIMEQEQLVGLKKSLDVFYVTSITLEFLGHWIV